MDIRVTLDKFKIIHMIVSVEKLETQEEIRYAPRNNTIFLQNL